MKTIHKYELVVEDQAEVSMPQGATVLSIQCQYDKPRVWALVDTDKPMQARRFCVRGTGHPMRGNEGAFVATFQMRDGGLVFHVFEENEP